jgi:predicted dehydrogenase
VEVNVPAGKSSAIGVALIGAGNLARWAHLPNLKRRRAFACVQSIPQAGRGKSYALRFGAEYCATDYAEILNDPEIQTVVIVSRNQQHVPQALAALRAGKHVFVEKPMALSKEECRELYQAVEKTGKQLTVGFNRRFAPTYRALKKQIAKRSGVLDGQSRCRWRHFRRSLSLCGFAVLAARQ